MELEPLSYYFIITSLCIWTNIKIEKHQSVYGTRLYIIHKMGDFLIILHINEAIAIFLLFSNNQDSESES